MLSIALYLAKWLIEYLLNKNWGLAKELQEAKNRVEEHQKALAQVEDDVRLLQREIENRLANSAVLGVQLQTVALEIEELERLRNEKLAKKKLAVDALSDADVLRSDI